MEDEKVFKNLIDGSEIRIDPKSLSFSKIFFIVKNGKCIFQVWFKHKDAHKTFLSRTRLSNGKIINFSDSDINLNCSIFHFYNQYIAESLISVVDGDDKKLLNLSLENMFKKYFKTNYIKPTIEDIEFENGWEFLSA